MKRHIETLDLQQRLQAWRDRCLAELPVLEALQKGILSGHAPAFELILESLQRLDQGYDESQWTAADREHLGTDPQLQPLRTEVEELLAIIHRLLDEVQQHWDERRRSVEQELATVQKSLLGRSAYLRRPQ